MESTEVLRLHAPLESVRSEIENEYKLLADELRSWESTHRNDRGIRDEALFSEENAARVSELIGIENKLDTLKVFIETELPRLQHASFDVTLLRVYTECNLLTQEVRGISNRE